MPGEAEILTARARRVLLDALEALAPHRDAVILVGAQAIYMHVGEAGLRIRPYTFDADLALDPRRLGTSPTLEETLSQAGFDPVRDQPGMWIGESSVPVDLMVPQSMGGAGRRGARLGPHGNRAARKAHGLEAAIVDRSEVTVGSLEAGDPRVIEVQVAGPGALLVAKLHKLGERYPEAGRASDKDALDVLRLLIGVSTENLAEALKMLAAAPISAAVTREALGYLENLFGTPDAPGSRMAARAAQPEEDPDTIAASCAVLAGRLLRQVP